MTRHNANEGGIPKRSRVSREGGDGNIKGCFEQRNVRRDAKKIKRDAGKEKWHRNDNDVEKKRGTRKGLGHAKKGGKHKIPRE